MIEYMKNKFVAESKPEPMFFGLLSDIVPKSKIKSKIKSNVIELFEKENIKYTNSDNIWYFETDKYTLREFEELNIFKTLFFAKKYGSVIEKVNKITKMVADLINKSDKEYFQCSPSLYEEELISKNEEELAKHIFDKISDFNDKFINKDSSGNNLLEKISPEDMDIFTNRKIRANKTVIYDWFIFAENK